MKEQKPSYDRQDIGAATSNRPTSSTHLLREHLFLPPSPTSFKDTRLLHHFGNSDNSITFSPRASAFFFFVVPLLFPSLRQANHRQARSFRRSHSPRSAKLQTTLFHPQGSEATEKTLHSRLLPERTPSMTNQQPAFLLSQQNRGPSPLSSQHLRLLAKILLSSKVPTEKLRANREARKHSLLAAAPTIHCVSSLFPQKNLPRNMLMLEHIPREDLFMIDRDYFSSASATSSTAGASSTGASTFSAFLPFFSAAAA